MAIRKQHRNILQMSSSIHNTKRNIIQGINEVENYPEDLSLNIPPNRLKKYMKHTVTNIFFES